jgi:hypothetical protein
VGKFLVHGTTAVVGEKERMISVLGNAAPLLEERTGWWFKRDSSRT